MCYIHGIIKVEGTHSVYLSNGALSTPTSWHIAGTACVCLRQASETRCIALRTLSLSYQNNDIAGTINGILRGTSYQYDGYGHGTPL